MFGSPRRSQRLKCSATASRLSVTSSHSQTIATLQPASRRRATARVSRSTFVSNLACQNGPLVFGEVALEHPGCRCQKQPWTKMTALCFGRTRSGCPGSLREWTRYRSPRRCSADLSASSGFVFLLLMPAIIEERFSGLTMSAKSENLHARPTRQESPRLQTTRRAKR